jgi:hypothetical protein
MFAGRAAVPGAVAEHHVDLLGFIQPHGDPVGEQVPDSSMASIGTKCPLLLPSNYQVFYNVLGYAAELGPQPG